jgi:hypothetical protein
VNLPSLRETHDSLRAESPTTLTDETDLMVDSLNTIAALLASNPHASNRRTLG